RPGPADGARDLPCGCGRARPRVDRGAAADARRTVRDTVVDSAAGRARHDRGGVRGRLPAGDDVRAGGSRDVRMARRGHEGPTLAGADAADGGVPAGFLRLRSGRRAPRRARHGWLSLAQTLSSSLATTG